MYRVSFRNPSTGEWVSSEMESEMGALNFVHDKIRGYYNDSEQLEDGTWQFWRGDALQGSIRPKEKDA